MSSTAYYNNVKRLQNEYGLHRSEMNTLLSKASCPSVKQNVKRSATETTDTVDIIASAQQFYTFQ